MEDNIQTIIVVIISAFLLFIFPVYLAYEKKDDISYALAMRYTQDLVDEVRSKGYITEYMYEDYRAKLKVTGNSYDIELTHEYNRYDPITNYYTKNENGEYVLTRTSTQEERKQFEQEEITKALEQGLLASDATDTQKQEYIDKVYESLGEKPEDTYMYSKQIYTTDHIVSILKSEKKLMLNANTQNVVCNDAEDAEYECQYAYTMNVDDNFNVTIKNTNTTLATVIYNMVTAHTLDNNTRIYVNYGGAILSSKWYGDIDYSKMKHDDLSLDPYNQEIIIKEGDVRQFTSSNTEQPIEKFTKEFGNEGYAMEFNVLPQAVTELKPKGNISVVNYSGFNFCIGNDTTYNQDNMLSVSVGINGISLIVSNTSKGSAGEDFPLPSYDYTYTNEDEELVTEQRTSNIQDYTRFRVKYIGNDEAEITDWAKIEITGWAKPGRTSFRQELTIKNGSLFKGLDYTINNPTDRIYTQNLAAASNNRGTNVKCDIELNGYKIIVNAEQYSSNETVILSYPVQIETATDVKIEFVKNEAEKYVAELYIAGERVAESIELDVLPKVNVVGKTTIGNETNFFEGSITDVKLYIQ